MPKKVDRARLFLSFDALKGFKELLVEDTSVPRKELCEDQCYELDWKIHQLKEGDQVEVIYYILVHLIQKSQELYNLSTSFIILSI